MTGLLTIRRSLVRRNGKTIIKDTQTHQMRVIKLDQDTVTILTAHKDRAQRRCAELHTTLDDDAFVFSYSPDHRRHCDPDGITHRYAKMTADLGINTHLHALRHYSATEFGVDLRTVADSLGHGGGGAITLKVYAAPSRPLRPDMTRSSCSVGCAGKALHLDQCSALLNTRQGDKTLAPPDRKILWRIMLRRLEQLRVHDRVHAGKMTGEHPQI